MVCYLTISLAFGLGVSVITISVAKPVVRGRVVVAIVDEQRVVIDAVLAANTKKVTSSRRHLALHQRSKTEPLTNRSMSSWLLSLPFPSLSNREYSVSSWTPAHAQYNAVQRPSR
jgi:hypothetical protein